jgi:hypothetical protein
MINLRADFDLSDLFRVSHAAAAAYHFMPGFRGIIIPREVGGKSGEALRVTPDLTGARRRAI